MKKIRSNVFVILIICSLFLSGCQIYKPETGQYKVKFDTHNWEPVEIVPGVILPFKMPLLSSDAGYSISLLPPLETLPDPKKEKVVITYKPYEAVTLDQSLQFMFNGMKKYCKSSSHKILIRNNNDVTVYATATGCKNNFYNQVSLIAKIFNRLDGQYTIWYEFASNEVSKEKIDQTKQVIMSATLVPAHYQKHSN